MNPGSSLSVRRKTLEFSTIVEAAMGLALIGDPAPVIKLLLGTSAFGQFLTLARMSAEPLERRRNWLAWPRRLLQREGIAGWPPHHGWIIRPIDL
jgi:hypothetical protein